MQRPSIAVLAGAALLAAGSAAAQVPDTALVRADTVRADTVAADTVAAAVSACRAIGAIGSITEDQARVAQLTGSAPPSAWLQRRSDALRTSCVPAPTPGAPLRAELLPASLVGALRTGYEGGRNDGALWQGKGLSGAFAAGARLAFSIVTLDIAPVVTYQQNSDYALVPIPADTVGTSPFANPWHAHILDVPQRFGDASYADVDLGQSRLSVRLGPFEAGLSNQSLWWGPGMYNALLMSNHAPGFPHAHVSTARPIDIRIGDLELALLGGQLRASEYQDTLSGNDETLFRGVMLTLAPRGFENLYLGFARTFIDVWEDPDIGDFFSPLFDSPFTQGKLSENSPGSQLLSFMGRWVLPASGFEAWVEWGREDHSADYEDFLQEPDHSQAFVLGFQKVVGTVRPVRFGAEWADLSHFTPPRAERPVVLWYTHSVGSYTNRGQWLGSATGTGGDSQHFWLDSYWGTSAMGAYLHRVRRYENAFYATRTTGTIRGHDVEVTAGVRAATHWRGVDLDAALEISHRFNRHFESDARNLGVRLGASWWPRSTAVRGIFQAPPRLGAQEE